MVIYRTQFVFVLVFTVAECLENLSIMPGLKCRASQSSSYEHPPLYQPDKAVDGYLEEERTDTCSFTLASYGIREAWWKLTLMQISNVAYLEIYFRNATVNRHTGFSVHLFNDSSYVPPSRSGFKVFTHNPSSCPEKVMNITVNHLTQGIALYNSKNPPVTTYCESYEPGFATIEICEVKVMGCLSNHYGETCAPCDLRCHNRQCDAFNGSCIYGCSNTFMEGSNCSCIRGHYGEYCNKICGHCLIGTICNSTTGLCPRGCKTHWTGPKCDECEDKKYGTDCTFDCGHCKDMKPCLKANGTCINGCESGWSGHACSEGDWFLKTPSIITLAVSAFLALTILCMFMRIVCKRRKRCCKRKERAEDFTDLSSNFENKGYIQTSVPQEDHGYINMKSTIKCYENMDMQIYQNP